MAETKATRAESAVAAAESAVIDARQALGQWRQRVVDAEAAVVTLEAESGEALLDDPDKASSWPVRLREARDHVTASMRATEAQEQRLVVVEREWCGAQAALLEVVEVAPARQALAAHEDRTKELLEALVEHDGSYVPEIVAGRAQQTADTITEGALPMRLPKVHALRVAEARAQIRYDVLAAMAEGRDPAGVVASRGFSNTLSEEDCYPDCVRGGGLVLAPAYLGRIATTRSTVLGLEEMFVELEAEIVDLEEKAAMHPVGTEGRNAVESWIARRRSRIEDGVVELKAARSELAALTGSAAS